MKKFSREMLCDCGRKAVAGLGGLCAVCVMTIGSPQLVPTHEVTTVSRSVTLTAPAPTRSPTGDHAEPPHGHEDRLLTNPPTNERATVVTPPRVSPFRSPSSSVRGHAPLRRTGWSRGSYGNPVTIVDVSVGVATQGVGELHRLVRRTGNGRLEVGSTSGQDFPAAPVPSA